MAQFLALGCMDIAALIYVWMPAALAVGCALGSIAISVRSPKFANICLTVVVGVAVYWSLFTLYEVVALNDGHALWFVVKAGRRNAEHLAAGPLLG